jgi:ribosome-associated toxin RatA of RatAB toxin-antitoxin module
MHIERTALVTHSAMDMYSLVADVPSYPQFLSWCIATAVHEQDSVAQKASLTVRIAGVTQQFTTINALSIGERVGMKLFEGPFRNLQGEWRFTQLGEAGCKVSLRLDFEMTGKLTSTVFGKGFAKVANRLVEDFCKRAETVYRS